MASGVEVRGDERLSAALGRAGRDLEDLGDTSADAARLVAAMARPRAPRRTGRLAASHAVVEEGPSGIVEARTVYANAIHWGWRSHNIEPQPWLMDTAERTQPQWLNLYERKLDEVIRACEGGP